ncbi:MAG TPA: hypothetical protein VK501_05535 [Baekduia sp.]|uniref:hypothetical protein n=1 Tax=Baekduia sp. TaxID=2600305 RepID=UPI002BC8D280|nr:hypothetical protein [Baekduia sp.]HMJ33358.1 hypothetical protein [Baekduia sp.]
MPAIASAEIRPGTANEATGDSAGAPSQDLVSATAQYDTNGQVIVSATVNGDMATGPASFSFRVASYSPPNSCLGASVSLFGFSDSQYSTTMVTGVSGTGSAPVTVNGNRISFSASGTALQTKDWSCMTVGVTPKGSGGQLLDELAAPMFFTGFGPDTDGDTVKDNQDSCPSQAGPAPTGCPVTAANPAPAPATTTPAVTTAPKSTAPAVGPCKPPKLKGKSLSAAKAALKKAHCKLGKVTQPKKPKKGAKLVVSKQQGKGPINVTLAPAKRK